ncbi:NAD(P)/FAD-dependent oxidoreductase [Streptomyces avicenniae]|uniref:NAD(P)/FAD-dependent oxidoreductase n=1 Tax=Streptomyces avicenniae TaxID=500153 RepID=UPI00069B31B9|nr:FAD-dependent oxidoreductase [Streptomyces avicenniae]
MRTNGAAADGRLVIVGGGQAAARLARRVLPGAAGSVTVLAEERWPAYNRVLLADVLAGRYPAEVIELPGPPEAVRWLPGARAVRIDRAARTVTCDDGGVHPYDTLVLATGANPVLPPLPGLHSPGHQLPDGVRALRTLDDCRALSDALDAAPGAAPAVVIGGGLLGVLASAALARRGARVLLAQRAAHLLDRHLDPEAAALLRAHLTDLGVEVHTECAVSALRTDPATGAVRGVRLADGYEADARLVVLACGVRPRVGLARDAGLPVGPTGGVVVDDLLTTADPRIRALGDCAEHAGVSYGLAGAATEQADVLAAVLSGDRAARYTGTRALVRLTLPDGPAPFDLAAFGLPVPGPPDDTLRLADGTRGTYRSLVVRDDHLRGGVLVGDLGGVGPLARAWQAAEPLPAGPLLHLLSPDTA